MRLDLFLKASRLVIRRSLAQELCSAGNVKINGIMARSSRDVKLNDKIELKRRNKLTTFRVAEVPDKKQVSREQAANLYEIIAEEFLEESKADEIMVNAMIFDQAKRLRSYQIVAEIFGERKIVSAVGN